MTYSDKLKSPKWQKKRLEILNLHKFKCDECKSEVKTLHVHHRFYLKGREPWEYDNDVFQVLCEDCHEKTHKKEDIIKENIPDIYREILSLLDVANDINPNTPENIKFLLTVFTEHIDDVEFLDNLSSACNSGYLDKLRYDLTARAEAECDSIRRWSAIYEIKKFLNINTDPL
jgi:uncharacterized protein YlaI